MFRNRFFRFCMAPDNGGAGGSGEPTPVQQTAQQTTQPQTVQFDYEKLAGIIQGKQTVAEETVLRNYFKEQGLSQDEAKQAIATFKAEKAKNTPDVGAMQTQLAQAQSAAQQAQLQSAATMQAVALGIDAKTIPYVLKLADFSQAVGQDGKISDEALKTALNKVLEDVPALKPQTQQSTGFTQVGVSGSQPQTSQTTNTPQNTVPTKRWNRFN